MGPLPSDWCQRNGDEDREGNTRDRATERGMEETTLPTPGSGPASGTATASPSVPFRRLLSAAQVAVFCYHSPGKAILRVTTALCANHAPHNSGRSAREHRKTKDCLVNTFNYMIIIIQFPLFNILYKTSYSTHGFSNATLRIKLHRYANLHAVLKLHLKNTFRKINIHSTNSLSFIKYG